MEIKLARHLYMMITKGSTPPEYEVTRVCLVMVELEHCYFLSQSYTRNCHHIYCVYELMS